jgi:hypothetical protein
MKLPFLKKILLGQEGFSLTEAVVGGAVLVGVGLAGAILMRDQTKAQSKNNYDQSLSAYHGSVGRLLEYASNCNATMHDFYNAPAISNSSLSAVQICISDCDFGLDAQTTPQQGAYIKVGDWTDDKQTWQLTDMAFRGTYNKTGPARIKMTYTLNPRIGIRTVSKDAMVSLRFGEGKFKQCINHAESSMNNLQKDICKAMGDYFVKWNDEIQTCELVEVDSMCPQGEMLGGLKPDGTVECRSITVGVNPNMSDSSSVYCRDMKTQILPDPTTKKLRVVCN